MPRWGRTEGEHFLVLKSLARFRAVSDPPRRMSPKAIVLGVDKRVVADQKNKSSLFVMTSINIFMLSILVLKINSQQNLNVAIVTSSK